MASPRKNIGDSPDEPARFKRARQESGTRRVFRPAEAEVPARAPANKDSGWADEVWADDPPPSLLSVASWLVDSVRGRSAETPLRDPGSLYEAPSITVHEASLTAEERAAIDVDLGSTVDEESAATLEVGQSQLSFDEAEAIDDFDLTPLRQGFERGDHLALLLAAEALLEVRPSMPAALRYLAAAREGLRRRFMTELGGQREVPRRLTSRQSPTLVPDEVFMLGLIDGQSTLEEIVDRSELPPLVALRLVDRLCALRLVACGAPHASYC
jgi:hypothetical protein